MIDNILRNIIGNETGGHDVAILMRSRTHSSLPFPATSATAAAGCQSPPNQIGKAVIQLAWALPWFPSSTAAGSGAFIAATTTGRSRRTRSRTVTCS